MESAVWSLLNLVDGPAAEAPNTSDARAASSPSSRPSMMHMVPSLLPLKLQHSSGLAANSSLSSLARRKTAQPQPLVQATVENENTALFPTRLLNLKVEQPKNKDELQLEDGYQVQRFDVLCLCRDIKDSLYHNHVGNNRFRVLVEMRVERYNATRTKEEKTVIIKEIVDAVQTAGGHFLRREAKTNQQHHLNHVNAYDDHDKNYIYYDIGYRKTLDKIGKAIRTVIKKRGKNCIKQLPRTAPPKSTPAPGAFAQPPTFRQRAEYPSNSAQHKITEKAHEDDTYTDDSVTKKITNARFRTAFRGVPNFHTNNSLQAIQQGIPFTAVFTNPILARAPPRLQLPIPPSDPSSAAAQLLAKQRCRRGASLTSSLGRPEISQRDHSLQAHEIEAYIRHLASDRNHGIMPSIVTLACPVAMQVERAGVPTAIAPMKIQKLSKGNDRTSVCARRSRHAPERTEKMMDVPQARIHQPTQLKRERFHPNVETTPTPVQVLSLDSAHVQDQPDSDNDDNGNFDSEEQEPRGSLNRNQEIAFQVRSIDYENQEDEYYVSGNFEFEKDMSWEQHNQPEDDDESDASSFYPRESEVRSNADEAFGSGEESEDDLMLESTTS